MIADDLLYHGFRWVAFGLGLKAVFGLGLLLAASGVLASCWKGLRLAAAALLLAGGAVAWTGFLAVSEVQAKEVVAPMITARFHAMDDSTREAAQAGLLVLPALAVLVKLCVDKLERDRRRSLLSTYLRIATKAYLDSDFDRAIAEFSIAIRVEPGREEIYIRRGQAFAQKGEYDLAIADFERALKLDDGLVSAYLQRGIVLAARGDHGQAIEDFDRAADLSPTDGAPFLHRGLSNGRLGDDEAAARDFRQVLRLTNHSDLTEPARFHLMVLDEAMQSGEFAFARA